MISIVKGIKGHRCSECANAIMPREMKVKDSQDNANRKYYHLGCTPRRVIETHLRLWTQALQESQQQ